MRKRDRRKASKRKAREKRVRQKKTPPVRREDPDPPRIEFDDPDPSSVAPTGPTFNTERILLAAQRMIHEQEFESEEEMNRFLNARIVGRRPEDLFPEDPTPEEEARELALCAMESGSTWDEVLFAKRALELDPTNLDAQRIRIVYFFEDEEDQAEQLALVLDEYLARAEEDFGADLDLGGDVYHRAYLRGLDELARIQAVAGDLDGSADTLRELIVLDRADRFGAVQNLLVTHLEAGQSKAAAEVRDDFEELLPPGLVAWAKVLERFLEGDLAGAELARAAARLSCAQVGALLAGEEDIRELDPEDETELDAITSFASLLRAWVAHPDALDWLREGVA
jgi:hypothetical protein